jgi:DNA repair protein RadD
MESLPPESSRIITGGTKKKERELIINQFKAMTFKYLVNVSVLTTGFDAPHVDVVAVLRATDSAGLFQQIIGRGLRLHDKKENCLILDYAENIERHCPSGDIFDPKIKNPTIKKGEPAQIECPSCNYQNLFALRQNPEEFDYNKYGYFIDLAGNQIETEDGPMPAHFGRRCNYVSNIGDRCEYRWTTKECIECGAENDIAARKCQTCKAILVDPNEKLQIEYKRIKSDPYEISTDKVLSWTCKEHCSQAGNITLRVDYTTDYRTFSVWYLPRKQLLWHSLCSVVFGKEAPDVETFVKYWKLGVMPRTITCKRDKGTKFFTVFDHNRPEDAPPSNDGQKRGAADSNVLAQSAPENTPANQGK